jgi:hypothetical protein
MALTARLSGRPVLSATRARQGRFGRHVFWVLLVSTALAALALFGAWTWRAEDMARTDVRAKSQAATQTQPFDNPGVVARQKPPAPSGY